jgi:hypothetical protein
MPFCATCSARHAAAPCSLVNRHTYTQHFTARKSVVVRIRRFLQPAETIVIRKYKYSPPSASCHSKVLLVNHHSVTALHSMLTVLAAGAGSGVHKVPNPQSAAAEAAAAAGPKGASSTSPASSAAAAAGPMSGPDTAFSGQAAAPDMPMSDRDFGVIQTGDLKGFVACVAGSPFAWQRTWWGWPLFALAARYCNSSIAALRAGRAAA